MPFSAETLFGRFLRADDLWQSPLAPANQMATYQGKIVFFVISKHELLGVEAG